MTLKLEKVELLHYILIKVSKTAKIAYISVMSKHGNEGSTIMNSTSRHGALRGYHPSLLYLGFLTLPFSPLSLPLHFQVSVKCIVKRSWAGMPSVDEAATYLLLLVGELARSDKAETLLLMRLALVVVVGDADGHAHTARHRACAPRRALADTPLRIRIRYTHTRARAPQRDRSMCRTALRRV